MGPTSPFKVGAVFYVDLPHRCAFEGEQANSEKNTPRPWVVLSIDGGTLLMVPCTTTRDRPQAVAVEEYVAAEGQASLTGYVLPLQIRAVSRKRIGTSPAAGHFPHGGKTLRSVRVQLAAALGFAPPPTAQAAPAA